MCGLIPHLESTSRQRQLDILTHARGKRDTAKRHQSFRRLARALGKAEIDLNHLAIGPRPEVRDSSLHPRFHAARLQLDMVDPQPRIRQSITERI